MGHRITGVIGKLDAMQRLRSEFSAQPCFALSDGFAFMPLDYENLDEITGLHDEEVILNFVYLTQRLTELLRGASVVAGEIAYIETEYHGGSGWQGAVLFAAGAITYGPAFIEEGVGPINDVLSRMGVGPRFGKQDAFDAVGLDDHRSNEGFRERASAI
jgi:hypothetical protein